MDAPLIEDEDTKFIDVFINNDGPDTDESLILESLNSEIQRTLATLSDKERDVLNLYYGIGVNHSLTLDEIAAKFDLTRERVRQIKEKAIRRLKHTSRSRLLKAYLGQ
jgi:RNA polymerase primary sigma factor